MAYATGPMDGDLMSEINQDLLDAIRSAGWGIAPPDIIAERTREFANSFGMTMAYATGPMEPDRDPDDVLQMLDDYGWPAQHTTLYDHTDRHALLKWDPPDDTTRWEIVDLRDGHRVAEFGTDDSGRDAFRLFARGPDE